MTGAPAEHPIGPLLERETDLERLSAALRCALDGSGALVVIAGSAGIGKTALVRRALRDAQTSGIAVAAGRGSELEREFAFGVVRQLLEPVLAAASTQERAEMLAGAAALAEPLFGPELLAEGEGRRPPDQSFSMLHGLYWLCANLASRRPLLLAVDDAHWADLASLRFLAYLGQRLEGLPLTLVVATRPAETPADDEALAVLERQPGAIVIAPEPLSASAVATVIETTTGQPADGPFTEACREATGGVPLLVRELVRALDDDGVEPIAGSVGRVEHTGPRTIARHVVARVRRFAPAAESLARAAAVLGSDADLPRAARLADVDGDQALTALDALVGAGIITSARPLEFTHPVFRAAIYGDLAPGERSRLHTRAAALLAEQAAADERVASHLLATEPSADEHVAGVLVRTARAAVARGAPASAAAYLERALAEPPPLAIRPVVLRELGVAELHAGRADAATGHLHEAYRLAQPGRERALIAQELAGCLRLRWRHQEAYEVTAAVVSELADDDDLALALRAELVLLEVLEPAVHGAGERPRPLPARRSLGVAKYLAARTAETVLRMQATAQEAHALAARAREAGIVEDLAHGGSLWINAVAPLSIADGFGLAEEMLAEAFEAGRERASLIFTTRAYVTRSWLRMRQGALPDAEADAQAALAAAGGTRFYFSLFSLVVLCEVLAERGDHHGADAALERFGMAGEIPDTFVHNWVLDARTRVRLAQGRLDAAIADFEELARRDERRGYPNPAVHPHRSGRALALLQLGEADRARELAAEEAALARQWDAPRAIGIALRTLGLCEGAIAHLRESVDVLDGCGAELEHARSLLELGAALRRSGRRSAAQEPLRAGMELAHRCGAPPLVDRAREELLATGARPRRVMRTGADALTPSETRVARMAADGLTNREIAQALFVTQRTVETHLTHVFQKLDIAARSELAEQLAG